MEYMTIDVIFLPGFAFRKIILSDCKNIIKDSLCPHFR